MLGLKISLVTIFLFSLILPFSIKLANGQSENNTNINSNTNSFQYCFNQGVAVIHLLPYVPVEQYNNNYNYNNNYASFFHPNLTIINATDLNNNPAWNTMIRNMCNFIHEKTGMWDSIAFSEKTGPYTAEFILRYWDTLPENFKEFVIDAVSFKGE